MRPAIADSQATEEQLRAGECAPRALMGASTDIERSDRASSDFLRALRGAAAPRAGDLHYTYVTTNENVADCMTKNNFYPAFKKFRAAMGVA